MLELAWIDYGLLSMLEFAKIFLADFCLGTLVSYCMRVEYLGKFLSNKIYPWITWMCSHRQITTIRCHSAIIASTDRLIGFSYLITNFTNRFCLFDKKKVTKIKHCIHSCIIFILYFYHNVCYHTVAVYNHRSIFCLNSL